MLPLLYLHTIKKPAPIANQSSFSDIAAGFVKYTLSNATSTSLLFALPLVLLAEMGDVIAADLAQVFYFTSLTYLIPHALSAKHIPNMRQYGIVPGDVTSFFLSIFIFVVFTSLLALPLIQHFYTQWIVYLMLFIAMQISQLSLPFSNVLMVKGQANKILKVNIVASTVLVILITLIMFNVTAGDNRAKLLLLSFIGFQLLKLLLNYSSAKEYIRVTH
ncbi:hypothetical protein GCM10009111_00740 [Colwellia asteriadis]|uniref:Polysaccharide biosynthesis protein n=2 Tax=Colwellia asteriadis TaxID=517723 RepID=A0ABN1L2Q0_9GAMM